VQVLREADQFLFSREKVRMKKADRLASEDDKLHSQQGKKLISSLSNQEETRNSSD